MHLLSHSIKPEPHPSFQSLLEWNNVTPSGYEIWPENYDAHLNAYRGGIFQQAVSALPETDQLSYELLDPNRFNSYGFEYQPSVSFCVELPILLEELC